MRVKTKSDVLHVTEATFEREVGASEVPVLVDFWADWCPPCKVIGPTVDELAIDFAGKARVAKVDVDTSPGLSARFGVASIPTIIVFRGGEEVSRVTGIAPKEKLAEMLESAIESA